MKVTDLTKSIDGKTIVTAIDFAITGGELVGLVGRNGSGKTTIFRTLAGNYLPDKGDILIGETSILQEPQEKQSLFYIDEQDNFLKSYQLRTINQFYRAAYPNFDQDLYITLMHQNQLNPRLSYRRMSKGMQGLYQMILAICSKAKYLLLDEPFDGLDVIVRKKVISLLLEHIAADDRCAIIASHNLDELEGIVDRVLLIKGHTIAKDIALEDTREKARKLQMVFRTKAVPQVVKDHAQVLSQQGRVLVAVFEDYTPKLAAAIKAEEPLLLEEMPLSLEDLFEVNLRTEAY